MLELGKILRVVVEGVMDVLQARAEIKSQFRLPLTRVQADENNPLKLSPNVESALHTLLVQRNPGFLPPAQAFEDAFTDIRNHQMAMLEGVRVAFESMLKSFDPTELEKEFERGKRGRLGFGGASPNIGSCTSSTSPISGAMRMMTFRRLFGDVFAEAYEKQLERLKTLAEQGKQQLVGSRFILGPRGCDALGGRMSSLRGFACSASACLRSTRRLPQQPSRPSRHRRRRPRSWSRPT